MKKVITLVAALALLLVGCGQNGSGGTNTTPPAELTVVKVAHLPSTLFAPVYIALDKGYFEDEGLDVQLEAVKSGQDAIPLLASGKLDALAAGFSAGMFNAVDQGLEFQIVGSMGVNTGNAEASPTMLLVASQFHQDGSITKVEDLRGKKIAAAGGPGSTGGFLTAAILATGGLTLNDVEIVNLATADMPNALANGAVDAALASAPTSGRIVADGVGVVLGVPDKGVGSSGLMFEPEFAKSENAQKFFNAVVRASADLQDGGISSEENLAILAKATGQEVDALKAVPPYNFDPKLAPNVETIKQMEAVWMSIGLITYTEPLDMSKLVNETFYKNVK